MKPDLLTPASAEAVFGDRLDLAIRYTEHLATTGVEWGLIGPREVPRLWHRHVLNCAVVADLVPVGATVVDLGSGAGLPGLAIAVRRPDLEVVLVEPLLRRVQWLEVVLADLQLTGVRVLRARAEELVGTVRAPIVTARAVAPLDRLARWGLPLLSPHGELLAMKGRTAQTEIDQTAAGVRAAGGVSTDVVTVGAGVLDGEVTTVVRVRVGAESTAAARRTASRRARDRGSGAAPP